jgi:lysophospholipase L1-like esterase
METTLNPRKLLFIGYSITDAFRRDQEVNEAFQVGNGYVFLIAAHLRYHFPGLDLSFINRGISGQAFREIAQRWDSDALEHQPEVITLLAGVNDLIRKQRGLTAYSEPDVYEEGLHKILMRAKEVMKPPRVILLEPFVLETGMVAQGWREAFEPYQAAVRRQATEAGADFVPLQSIFDQASELAPPSHWSFDGIHPSPGGFMCIARAWLEHQKGSFVQ